MIFYRPSPFNLKRSKERLFKQISWNSPIPFLATFSIGLKIDFVVTFHIPYDSTNLLKQEVELAATSFSVGHFR